MWRAFPQFSGSRMNLDIPANQNTRTVKVGFGSDSECIGCAWFPAVVHLYSEPFDRRPRRANHLRHSDNCRVRVCAASAGADKESINRLRLDADIRSMVLVL